MSSPGLPILLGGRLEGEFFFRYDIGLMLDYLYIFLLSGYFEIKYYYNYDLNLYV